MEELGLDGFGVAVGPVDRPGRQAPLERRGEVLTPTPIAIKFNEIEPIEPPDP